MRSLLFIPGDDEKKLGKGVGSGADALILDLEDSVGAARKGAARQVTAQYIAATRVAETRPRLYVRINALDTPLWEDDLAGVMGSGPDGILLPKARSGEDVHNLSIALHHAEERAGASTGATRIIAIATEVAVSLLRMNTYLDASARLEGLTWGAEDLAAAVGAQANREPDGSWTSPYSLARNLCLFTAVAANAQPIDTVFVNFRDEQGFRREASTAARDGFTGKMAIHPNQVAAINEIFTPKPEEVARAHEIVQAFADHPDAGVLAISGHMVDRAHVKGAERILARARAAGRYDTPLTPQP
jgi:citrate lyase subunit beta/citryl-CoA lyase